MTKRVLLTGATGFVGANLLRRLLPDGHETHLIVRPNASFWRIAAVQDDVQIHTVDLADSESVKRLVADIRPEWIFHLATYGAYSSQTDLQKIVQMNILSTINLVSVCADIGFEAFINTGSSSEYGFKDHAPTEQEWIEPNSYYAVTKASATLFCRYLAQRTGLRITTLRLYSVYGPFEEPTRLLPTLITYGLDGRLPVLASPEIARDYIYTDDVIEAYILAAQHEQLEVGAVYNVGTGAQISLQEIVDVARRELNITVEPRWGSMANRQWDTRTWVANSKKLQSQMHWEPHNTFVQGFRQMVAWFRENQHVLKMYQERLNKENNEA